MEEKEFYKILVQRYIDKQLTDDELELFVQLTKEGKLDEHLLAAMNEDGSISKVDESDYDKQIRIRPLWFKIAAAASVVITLSIGLYFYFDKPERLSDLKSIYALHDADPGGNKATLTLADGSRISLTDAVNGQIAKQAGVTITKNAGGQLVYTIVEKGQEEVLFNTITTPRGGEYQVNLPDGTKVWLNSESSIKFPTSFVNANNRRRVNLTGEAYFEVSKNKKLPFIVMANNQEVEVLGTHFNINSYQDEIDTRTTLLEGSVKVKHSLSPTISKNTTVDDYSKILKPGQQARTTSRISDGIKVGVANLEQVMAWKNGYFHFENDNLRTVMNQLSRWYDVEVVYEANRVGDEFTGDVPRNVKLSEVLKALTYSGGVHFQIEGKKLIITK